MEDESVSLLDLDYGIEGDISKPLLPFNIPITNVSKDRCENIYKAQNKEPHAHSDETNIIWPVNNSSIMSLNEDSLKESTPPKFCSTPIHSKANSKRKFTECNKVSYKRSSVDFGDVSPASIVKARIQKCIKEAEKRFSLGEHKESYFERVHPCRRSLDSMLTRQRYFPMFRRETNLTFEQKRQRSYLQTSGVNTELSVDFLQSLKSLQKPVYHTEFSKELSYQEKGRQRFQCINKSEMKDARLEKSNPESTELDKFNVNYHKSSIEDESIIEFCSSEEEEKCDELSMVQEQKIYKTNESAVNFETGKEYSRQKESLKRASKSVVNIPIAKFCNSKTSAIEKGGKLITNKALGKGVPHRTQTSMMSNLPSSKLLQPNMMRNKSDSYIPSRKNIVPSTKSFQTKQMQTKSTSQVGKVPKVVKVPETNKKPLRNGKR